MSRKTIKTTKAPGAIGPYSQAVQAGNLLFISGQIALDPQTAAERRASMRSVNPLYIPRNHLVEEAIAAAVEESDLAPFRRLLQVLSSPYEEQASAERYATPPRPEEVVHQTFCGT